MPTSLITMEEFWTYTDTSLSVDGFMARYLIPASERVRTWCDDDFGVRDVEDERRMSPMTLDGDLRIDFIVKPVIAVTGVDLVYGGSSSELDISNGDLFRPGGYMLLPFAAVTVCAARIIQAGTGVGYLTLGDEYITDSTYSGGAEVPIDVREAVALVAWEDYLVKTATSTSGDPSGGLIKSYSVGRYSETRGKLAQGSVQLPGTLGWGTALGTKAEQLLLTHRNKGAMILGVL